MNIAKKLPDSLKRHVFEYNPDHRKFLKDVQSPERLGNLSKECLRFFRNSFTAKSL